MQSLNRLLTSTRTVVKDLSDVPPTKEEFAKAMEIAKQIKLPQSLKNLMSANDQEVHFIPDDLYLASTSDDLDLDLDDEGFLLRYVDNDEEFNLVMASISTKERWEARNWLDTAYKDRSVTLVSVRREDTDEREGFIAYRRAATVELHDGLPPVLSYSVDLDSVYVRPESRGNHLSTALRRALIEDVYQDVPYIADKFRDLEENYDVLLNFRVLSEPITDEGYKFTEALSSNLNELVEEHLTADEILALHDKDAERSLEMAYA